MKIAEFIEAINDTDSVIAEVYKNGACYRFALLLEKMYPHGYIVVDYNRSHAAYLHGDGVYDIDGKQPNSIEWQIINELQRPEFERWSFSRNRVLAVGECPHCEEPII